MSLSQFGKHFARNLTPKKEPVSKMNNPEIGHAHTPKKLVLSKNTDDPKDGK